MEGVGVHKLPRQLYLFGWPFEASTPVAENSVRGCFPSWTLEALLLLLWFLGIIIAATEAFVALQLPCNKAQLLVRRYLDSHLLARAPPSRKSSNGHHRRLPRPTVSHSPYDTSIIGGPPRAGRPCAASSIDRR